MNENLVGFDVTIRRVLTPVALAAVVALAGLAIWQAAHGEKPGALGALLVMVVTGSVAAKFAAEAFLFSHLGGDDSPRERIASRMLGSYAWLTKARFLLSALGGIVLPLGVQILSAGLKDVRPVTDPALPAAVACFAVALLLPGELAERKLWRLATDGEESTLDSQPAPQA